MKSNENFRFVAPMNLALFTKSASGATWGYMFGREVITGGYCILEETQKGRLTRIGQRFVWPRRAAFRAGLMLVRLAGADYEVVAIG